MAETADVVLEEVVVLVVVVVVAARNPMAADLASPNKAEVAICCLSQLLGSVDKRGRFLGGNCNCIANLTLV